MFCIVPEAPKFDEVSTIGEKSIPRKQNRMPLVSQRMTFNVHICQVTGLSVSGGPDQLLCIHLTGGNDLVLCLQSRRDPNTDLTGEAVGIMVRLFQM